MEIVGVAVMASEKPAVMVTTSEVETKLSLSVSVRVTVGAVVSKVKVRLSVPEWALPARSAPAAVAL